MIASELIDHLFKNADHSRLAGGDINDVFLVNSNNSDLVVKINSKSDYPNMFEVEAKGLELLKQAIKTPDVQYFGEEGSLQYLILEHIVQGPKTKNFWLSFGQDLAALHKRTDSQFGLDHHNYIGSLHQSNTQHENWIDFLVTERLEVMIKLAVDQGEIGWEEAKLMNRFYVKLDAFYPHEAPSLIHGDLWGGNYLCSNEQAVLIDPAVYFGHREMDIGMMHLFGGFDPLLFNAYNEVYPLEKGWEERIPFHQIYPLMVHVNLFGGTYWRQVYNILRQFA
ncbi:MAG: fructosamine kinase family protein [Crocinitomicaceae bacterium]|nr:fructosamine kinase family protein [Crocinitomicaceae bacterium]